MILFINGTRRGIHYTHVGYPISDYESAFELLTNLVADGWALQEAVIFDDQDRMNVPVEAFDGQPVTVHISALQRQWQQMLDNQPIPPAILDNQQLKEWHIQLESYYVQLIEHLEQTISRIEFRKTRIMSYPDKVLRLHLQEHYDRLLTKNQRMCERTKESRKENRSRLSKLMND